jgi:hypothetical protein
LKRLGGRSLKVRSLFLRRWGLTVGGENEADRQLLVEFDVVISEFNALDKKYRDVIQEIAKRMGNGMADYANNAAHNLYGVDTLEDFDMYCYYVAGLVGEGLTRLFISSGKENPKLSEAHDLYPLLIPETKLISVLIQWVYSCKRPTLFEIIVKISTTNGGSGLNKSGRNTQKISPTLQSPKISMQYVPVGNVKLM